ncbi:MAG: biotin transporter BioY [Elusimicrobiota bacterium]
MRIATKQSFANLNSYFAAKLHILRAVNIVAFALLIAFGARLYIPLPFTPVPITLQTFFVTLSGVFLGSIDAFASTFLYVLLGLAGLPVFSAEKAGMSVFLGPTGGYIIGFIFASSFVGATLKRGYDFGKTFLLFLSAHLLIYFFGVLNLMLVFNYTVPEVIQKGVMPFLPGDTLKAVLASLITAKFIPSKQRLND